MAWRKKRRRCIVVAQADGHSGHRLGLCNPDTVIVRETDDGDWEEVDLERTQTQDMIWDIYLDGIGKVIDLAGGDDIIILNGGDVTHGTKYREGLMPITESEQIQVAVETMKPWLKHKNVKAIRFFSGTPAHVNMGYVTSEAKVAAMLANETNISVRALHHGRVRVLDKVLDVAHHGPGKGLRWWLDGNQARYYLRDRMAKDFSVGKRPADVYIRAHRHVWVHEVLDMALGSEVVLSHITVLPSLCGMDEHSRQVTYSEPTLMNGLCAFSVVPFVTITDLRVEETIL